MDPNTWEKWWTSRSAKRFAIEFVKKRYFNEYFANLPLRFGPPVEENDIVAELGSGMSGALPIVKNKTGCQTIGFDLDEQISKIASHKSDFFIRGDIFDLPFKDQSLDVCFNQGVIEHFDDPQIHAILKEVRRVCRKKAVFCVPSVTSVFKHVYNPFDELDGRFMSKEMLVPIMNQYFVHVGCKYLIGSGLLSLVTWGEIPS